MADQAAPEGETPEVPTPADAAEPSPPPALDDAPNPEAATEAAADEVTANTPVETDESTGVVALADVPDTAAATPAPAVPAAPAAPDMSPAACGARVAELFPALFAIDGPRQPVKLRIQADIQQRTPGVFSKRVLSVFLSRYTTTTAYLKALSTAPARIDLDGQPAGEIDAVHRQAAIDELTRRRELHEERRRAERQAQRDAERSARRDDAAAQQQRRADDQAERDRAALLRTFETSTLTLANFCALKGLTEADLEARLAQARHERNSRPPESAPQGPRDRPDDRGPRDRGPRGNQPERPERRPSGPPRGERGRGGTR